MEAGRLGADAAAPAAVGPARRAVAAQAAEQPFGPVITNATQALSRVLLPPMLRQVQRQRALPGLAEGPVRAAQGV